jgi:hypothetical protein
MAASGVVAFWRSAVNISQASSARAAPAVKAADATAVPAMKVRLENKMNLPFILIRICWYGGFYGDQEVVEQRHPGAEQSSLLITFC